AQVLVTLGVSFMVADLCLMGWGGDPISVATPPGLSGFIRAGAAVFPLYRLAVIVIAAVFALALWLMLERTRLGAMNSAGVDDPQMARVVGIRVSRLFTIVFALGAGLAGFAGLIGGPILSVYPGIDQDMLPLALVVVILGGTGSLLGSFVGSIVIGFIYNFGQALLPGLAYFILFLPMVLVLVLRPQGLFGGQVLGATSLSPALLPRWSLLSLWRPCLTRSRKCTTSISLARFCCMVFSRLGSISWSVMPAWCHSAMPGYLGLPLMWSLICSWRGTVMSWRSRRLWWRAWWRRQASPRYRYARAA